MSDSARKTIKELRVHPSTAPRLRTMLAVEDSVRELNGVNLAAIGRLADVPLVEDERIPRGQLKVIRIGEP